MVYLIWAGVPASEAVRQSSISMCRAAFQAIMAGELSVDMLLLAVQLFKCKESCCDGERYSGGFVPATCLRNVSEITCA